MSESDVVTPGTRIGSVDTHISGRGTYTRDGRICASVVGRVVTKDVPNQDKKIIEVESKQETTVPQIGSIVLATVVKTTTQFAKVDITCVEGKALETTFMGMIRQQDVRATEIDKVVIYESFRPGDVVRAVVISLGDSKSYYLSTARNELGVVFGTSMAGQTLVPVSWKEMECPKTHLRELRKVAKTI
ncbi:exosome complex protein Csl4 [Acrasis kona]|uniref:Exosome complex protein Csl4 n=1 Tax=Acrasis kona TaxID=1008807 RepID=A0AAW2YRD1_9EUKA